MPKDVVFEHPVQEELVTDTEKIEEIKAGADIYCGFCGNRNSALSENCSNCGAPLAEGEERESGTTYQVEETDQPEQITCSVCGTSNPAGNLTCASCGSALASTIGKIGDEKEPASQPPKGKTGPGCIIGAVIMAIIAIAAIYFLFIRTQANNAVVTATNWQSSVEIIGLVTKEGSDWYNEVPSNGVLGNCSERVRSKSDSYVAGSKEVCGAPYYVDKGNGYSEKVQDCHYEIFDDYCTYKYKDWDVVSISKAEGSDLVPYLPEINFQSNQRRGQERIIYSVSFQDAEGKTYSYTPTSLQDYQTFQVNAEYQLETNALGGIISLEKK
jgi:DNA-directed RNA polymerase subunit RPC12/RpoP